MSNLYFAGIAHCFGMGSHALVMGKPYACNGADRKTKSLVRLGLLRHCHDARHHASGIRVPPILPDQLKSTPDRYSAGERPGKTG
jgi:hypothetical protein